MIEISEYPFVCLLSMLLNQHMKDIVWVVKRLMSKQSVLIECDKQLYPYLFQVLRGHFDRGSFRLIRNVVTRRK